MSIFTKTQLLAEVTAKITDNVTGAITAPSHAALLRDIIDSSAAGAGSDVLDRLQWHPTTGWTPTSPVQTQYLIATAVDDFDTLRRAIVQALTAGGSEADLPGIPAFVSTRLGSYLSLGGANTGGNDALLDDLWPVGSNPPFVWLVTPTAFRYLSRSRVNVSTRRNNSNLDPQLEPLAVFGATAYTIVINETPYDVGRYRTQLARPIDDQASPDEAALRFQYRFSAPAPAAPVVEQIP